MYSQFASVDLLFGLIFLTDRSTRWQATSSNGSAGEHLSFIYGFPLGLSLLCSLCLEYFSFLVFLFGSDWLLAFDCSFSPLNGVLFFHLSR